MIVNKRILKKKVSILRKGEGVYGTISRLIRVPSAIMVSSDTHLPVQTGFPLSPWHVPQCPSDAGNEIVMIRHPSVKCIPYQSGLAGKDDREGEIRSIRRQNGLSLWSSDTSELLV